MRAWDEGVPFRSLLEEDERVTARAGRARRGLLRSSGPCATPARSSTPSTRSRRRTPLERGLMDGPGLPLVYRGQGARPLRRRRRAPADGGVRPDLGLRRGDGRAGARQGPGAHRDDRVLVRAPRRRRRQPPRLDRAGRPARRPPGTRAGRADDARAPRRDAADRVHRARLPPGSAWKEYRDGGHDARRAAARRACGRPSSCPSRCSRRRPRPRAASTTRTSPSTTPWRAIGGPLAEAARDIALAVYERAAAHAEARGIIIADTKFELGLIDGEPGPGRRGAHARLVALLARATSGSRGRTPPSFDKQPVRDWLEATGWDKTPAAAPAARPTTVSATRARYVEAYERLTGRSFDEWPGGRGA